MSEIVMIASGKGGVGKTTLSAFLGQQLSRWEKRVVLLDADIGMRNLDIHFSMENKIRYNLSDVCNGICSVKQVCIMLEDNLYIVPGTKDSHFFPTKENFSYVINRLAEEFDFIIIDSPAGLTPIHEFLVPWIQSAITTLTWDKASLMDAISMCRFLKETGCPVYTVWNNQNRIMKGIGIEKEIATVCEDVLQSQYLGHIPYCSELQFENKKIRKAMSSIGASFLEKRECYVSYV